MVRFFPYRFTHLSRKCLAVLLALGWVCGICLGLYAASYLDRFSVSVIQAGFAGYLSFSGLFAVLVLPVVFVVFAVYTYQMWLLVPFSFLKALAFSFVGATISLFSGSAWWLVRLLYLFSDCFSAFALYWLFLHCLSSSRRDGLVSCAVTAMFFLMICYIDFQFISPLLSDFLS